MRGPWGRREKSGARRGGRRAGYGPQAAEEVMGAGEAGGGKKGIKPRRSRGVGARGKTFPQRAKR
ncbi:MAG: hypothetical protein CL678_11165 [Bdellovibrionaceae bacterium]|nr:hypothetical protein [Pseudobdellovibrionaceae bacterium]